MLNSLFLDKGNNMKVKTLIQLLSQCNQDADVEIRGTVNDEYIAESDIAVDSNDDIVVLDI